MYSFKLGVYKWWYQTEKQINNANSDNKFEHWCFTYFFLSEQHKYDKDVRKRAGYAHNIFQRFE